MATAHAARMRHTTDVTANATPSDTPLAAVCDSAVQVNTEDIGVCERVQEGTASHAYGRGRFSYRFEEPLHRFQNMVADKMLLEQRIPEGDKETMLIDLPERVLKSGKKEKRSEFSKSEATAH